jgi:hypothetical protein
LCLIGSLFYPANAQQVTQNSFQKRVLPAVKTKEPPIIDGDIADPAWKLAPTATTFIDIQNGNPVAEQTSAALLYDEKYLYVSFHAKDSQPNKIVAREVIRDYKFIQNFDPLSEDSVDIAIDPFENHRSEERTIFSLNALGTRSVRLAGGRGNKLEWRGDWDGAVKRVSDGWTAEMRIPWASLNYPNSRKAVNMGINFARYQNRTRLMSIWSDIGPQYFFDRDGVLQGVELPAGAFKPKVSLLPYILPGYVNDRTAVRTGLDVRYTPTPELTAVATINPDLATVEGAVEGIQFSRSERFVAERRPFFLEGDNYFSNDGNNIAALYFYAPRIRQFDVGTKLYGKVTPKDTIGILHTLRFGGDNDLITRYCHQFSATSSGGIFFSQKSAGGDNNTVGMVEHSTRWGKFRLDSELSLTSGKDSGGSAKRVQANYSDKLLNWSLTLNDIAPQFRVANGLVFFQDYRGPILSVGYSAEWRKGFWRRIGTGTGYAHLWHHDGNPFARGSDLGVSLESRSDWSLNFFTSHFNFDGQRDAIYGMGFTANVSNRFRQWGFMAQSGVQGDRPSTMIAPQFSFRVFRKLDLVYFGTLLNLEGQNQQHILTLNYDFSPTRSLVGRVVMNQGNTNWYLSYRNSGGKGTEVFFVLGDPNAPRFQTQFRVKFVFSL